MILNREVLEQIRDAALAMIQAQGPSGQGMDRLRASRCESLARAADDLLLDLSRNGSEPLREPSAAAVGSSPERQAEAELAELRELAHHSTGRRLEPGARPEETERLIEADEAAFRRQHPRG